MKLVEIESPYAGDVERNLEYARAAMRDSLMRGEAPIGSHLIYTQPGILDDTIPEEREMGMEAGKAWGRHAELVAVYMDLGLSGGMKWGIDYHMTKGTPIEYRTIPEWDGSVYSKCLKWYMANEVGQAFTPPEDFGIDPNEPRCDKSLLSKRCCLPVDHEGNCLHVEIRIDRGRQVAERHIELGGFQ